MLQLAISKSDSPFQKIAFICFNKIPENDENVYYFMLKILLALEIFEFCLDVLLM